MSGFPCKLQLFERTFRSSAGADVESSILRKGQNRAGFGRRGLLYHPKCSEQICSFVPWHRTQRVSWNDDGSLDFQVLVAGLHEISSWILGYGNETEVIEPPELREIVIRGVAGMAAIYND